MSRTGFFGGAALWATVGVTSLVVALPGSAVTPPGLDESRRIVGQVWPQGWSFFTKSPRSPVNGAYTVSSDSSDGAPRSALIGPNSSPSNVFGASRRARAQGPELASLTFATPKRAWKKCDGYTVSDCEIGDFGSAPKIRNESPIPTLCGKTVLTAEEPVPWAWRKLTESQFRIVQAAEVDIQC
ncbi:SdpA family antimicrobial peptide system protein [Streptomyces phaeolivaceus]|uniref:SdpA family antimicrobial peptide system protein n=1 Tax=Streptomyces phaeolivaceus TaxID=2653200 RepID=A0A5P8K436_9ACTN|nr:SdpA family antimicrobial peptide system protein [Streptomyces phaeolivaceus]QFQ97532.1 SdpA family antimicrobial peptide system protein [Streptomyces phaeolivaceus]